MHGRNVYYKRLYIYTYPFWFYKCHINCENNNFILHRCTLYDDEVSPTRESLLIIVGMCTNIVWVSKFELCVKLPLTSTVKSKNVNLRSIPITKNDYVCP